MSRGVGATLIKEMLPSDAEARKYGYAEAVSSGNMLFLSGHVALASDGQVVGKNNFARQVRCVFENLQTTLKLKGATLKNLVKITVYLTDISNLKEFRRIRSEYFKDWFPASTLVEVESLIMKDLMIEIDGIAILEK
jgi:2-iminobutanoate/2-iminopropanoate deaminase